MSAIAFEQPETPGLISVVIPTYRGERFIGEALKSIAAQTDRNWEVIVVEDGSRGPTEQIVREFASRHSSHRVCYRRSDKNHGPSHTRNTAFTLVRGEFVALLDADDRWYPGYLAVMREALNSTGKDVVYCSVVMIEDKTDLLIGVWGPERTELNEFPHGLLKRNFVTPSATVLRRSVLAEVGNWNTQHRYCEDLEFWLRCAAANKTFHYVGGVHCLYRRNHEEAATGKMCAVQEAHALIADRFTILPNTREKLCRKYVSQAYLRAADFHERCSPFHDSSADRLRAPRMLFRAWQLRRQHMNYLWRALKLTVRNTIRPPKRPRPATVAASMAVDSATKTEAATKAAA